MTTSPMSRRAAPADAHRSARPEPAVSGADSSVRLQAGLEDTNSSVRLQAALAVGTRPDPRLVDLLVDRCAIEPDFFVRDMLTWALTRHPVALTMPRLIGELRSDSAQARSQALHTLSKIGDRTAWPAITRSLLRDPSDEVARSAWRAAVALVPEDQASDLAGEMIALLGRGDREMQLSLSRALVALGEAARPVLAHASESPDPAVRAHAVATENLAQDPGSGFALALEEARRTSALGPQPGEDADRC
jgi:HEAT repeat protein